MTCRWGDLLVLGIRVGVAVAVAVGVAYVDVANMGNDNEGCNVNHFESRTCGGGGGGGGVGGVVVAVDDVVLPDDHDGAAAESERSGVVDGTGDERRNRMNEGGRILIAIDGLGAVSQPCWRVVDGVDMCGNVSLNRKGTKQ